MRLVALSNINHNGETYTIGEIIEGIGKEDGERLVRLGVAEVIEEAASSEEKEEKKTPSKKKATNDKEEAKS